MTVTDKHEYRHFSTLNQDMALKVLVVDDSDASARGAISILEDSLADGSEVIACSDTRMALTEILVWDPDIVVCDINFGKSEAGGYTLADRSWEASSFSKFVMYTSADIHVAALMGDIKGLVGKNVFAIEDKGTMSSRLVDAVKRVADGVRSYDAFTVREAKALLPEYYVSVIETFSDLTPRQMQLIHAYTTEPDRKSVAESLGVSESTVKNSISRLLQSFGYDSMRLVVSKYTEYLKVLEELNKAL